jgi:hypothetical protein
MKNIRRQEFLEPSPTSRRQIVLKILATAAARPGTTRLFYRRAAAVRIPRSRQPVLLMTGQGRMGGYEFFQIATATGSALWLFTCTGQQYFIWASAVQTTKIK